MTRVTILKIFMSCDVDGCNERYDLRQRGIRHVWSEFQRAKRLGWVSTRLKGGPMITATSRGHLKANGWFGECPQHARSRRQDSSRV